MYVVTEADAAAIRDAQETGASYRRQLATPPLPRHHGQRQSQGAGEGYRWVARCQVVQPSPAASQRKGGTVDAIRRLPKIHREQKRKFVSGM